MKLRNIFEQVDDALGDDARFAASRPGNHQQGSRAVLDCLTLFGVEFVDERLHGVSPREGS